MRVVQPLRDLEPIEVDMLRDAAVQPRPVGGALDEPPIPTNEVTYQQILANRTLLSADKSQPPLLALEDK